MPGFEDIVDGLSVFLTQRNASLLEQEVAWVVINELMRLYQNPATGSIARSNILEALERLRKRLGKREGWHRSLSRVLDEFLSQPMKYQVPAVVTIPPGSPI